MSKITIITNNIPRHTIYGHELPEDIRTDFDYLDDIDGGTFFKYKDEYYDIGEFLLVCDTSTDFAGWHGVAGDSIFSGVLIKLSDCGDYVTVGRFYQ